MNIMDNSLLSKKMDALKAVMDRKSLLSPSELKDLVIDAKIDPMTLMLLRESNGTTFAEYDSGLMAKLIKEQRSTDVVINVLMDMDFIDPINPSILRNMGVETQIDEYTNVDDLLMDVTDFIVDNDSDNRKEINTNMLNEHILYHGKRASKISVIVNELYDSPSLGLLALHSTFTAADYKNMLR